MSVTFFKTFKVRKNLFNKKVTLIKGIVSDSNNIFHDIN